MVSEIFVIASFLTAGMACLYYAIAHRQTIHILFGWLAIPSFTISGLYMWFMVADISLQMRVIPVRLSFIFMGLMLTIVTLIISYTGKHKS